MREKTESDLIGLGLNQVSIEPKLTKKQPTEVTLVKNASGVVPHRHLFRASGS